MPGVVKNSLFNPQCVPDRDAAMAYDSTIVTLVSDVVMFPDAAEWAALGGFEGEPPPPAGASFFGTLPMSVLASPFLISVSVRSPTSSRPPVPL